MLQFPRDSDSEPDKFVLWEVQYAENSDGTGDTPVGELLRLSNEEFDDRLHSANPVPSIQMMYVIEYFTEIVEADLWQFKDARQINRTGIHRLRGILHQLIA